MSERDLEVHFSVFKHARDAVPKPCRSSWVQFAEGLLTHSFDIPEKLGCPMFCPAEFREGATSRRKENVVRVSVGVLDLDGIAPEQVLRLCEKLEKLDSVVYTTWNHPESFRSSGLSKLRACVRLSRPVELREWSSFWIAFRAYFDNLSDPQCKDPCRCYFGAFAPPGTPRGDCAAFVNQGKALDVDALLSEASASRAESSAPPAKLSTPFAKTVINEAGAFASLAETSTSPRAGRYVSRAELERVARKWSRSTKPQVAHLGDVLIAVCKGEPFAEPGNRDNTLYQVCQDLARQLPDADPGSVAVHFAASLQISGADAPTVDDVRYKLERAQAEIVSEELAEEQAALAESSLRIREAFAKLDPGRQHPYSETELGSMAARVGCSREEMSKRWVIQRGGQFYLLGPRAIYSPAYSEMDVAGAALRELAPAVSAGVELWEKTDNGRRYKGPAQLVRDHGTVARNVVLDLSAQEGRYDPSEKVFIEAPCPLRNLEPAFDQEVDQWLAALAGPEHYKNLLNWLAHVTDLHLTCAALCLIGGPGAGKSLFADGVSRLWTTNGPTTLASAIGDFNDSMAACPVIFADEKLPTDLRGCGRTAELREFIAARSRPFSKKFCHATKILGAVRLIIAANNEGVFAIKENLSADDIAAIAERIYYLPIRPEAVEFLKTIDVKSFVDQDRIAKHALWLRDNFPKTQEGRFLIKPPNTDFYTGLSTREYHRSKVLQWLLGYLQQPGSMDCHSESGVWVEDGALYVRPASVVKWWSAYGGDLSPPEQEVVTRALHGISTADRKVPPRDKGGTALSKDRRKRCRKMNLECIYEWAERHDVMTREEIDEVLATDTRSRVAAQHRGVP